MKDETKLPPLTEEELQLFQQVLPEDEYRDLSEHGAQRRHFLKLLAILGGSFPLALWGDWPGTAAAAEAGAIQAALPYAIDNAIKVSFRINGVLRSLEVDPRMTLLDTLRERLQLTGSKKGCDHGQCGACTVLVEGNRVLSCLTLAATCEGQSVTTVEGLSTAGELHPVQTAFVKHDGFQCGYCTPGQICSAVGLLREARRGDASYVTDSSQVRRKPAAVQLSEEEIRERMSGNICRCGAYPNIVAAIREVQSGQPVKQTWTLT